MKLGLFVCAFSLKNILFFETGLYCLKISYNILFFLQKMITDNLCKSKLGMNLQCKQLGKVGYVLLRLSDRDLKVGIYYTGFPSIYTAYYTAYSSKYYLKKNCLCVGY